MNNTTTICLTAVIVVGLIIWCIVKCNEICHREYIAKAVAKENRR